MTKSTTALPRSLWSSGPSAGSRREPVSGGGQRGPSSATGGDGAERVRHRIHDGLPERDEDREHEGRRHHRDHHPARDVAPLWLGERGQGGGQVGECAHLWWSFLRVRCHRASETMLISPGNRAKRTVTGSTRKTTGTAVVKDYPCSMT